MCPCAPGCEIEPMEPLEVEIAAQFQIPYFELKSPACSFVIRSRAMTSHLNVVVGL